MSCREKDIPRLPRAVVVNNLCAKAFLPFPVDIRPLKAVSQSTRVDFGCVIEVFSMSSCVSIKSDLQTVLVKGGNDFMQTKADLALLAGGRELQGLIDLNVHMLVLSASLGVNVDVNMGCLLERVLYYKYKKLFTIQSRHEECSNHVEVSSKFTQPLLADFAHCLLDPKVQDLQLIDREHNEITLHMSISRFGEVLFR
eukprot:2994603-Rhodomonas_salina.1